MRWFGCRERRDNLKFSRFSPKTISPYFPSTSKVAYNFSSVSEEEVVFSLEIIAVLGKKL